MVTTVLLPGEMLFDRPAWWAYCVTRVRHSLKNFGCQIVRDEALQAGYGMCPDYWSIFWKEHSYGLCLGLLLNSCTEFIAGGIPGGNYQAHNTDNQF